MSRNRLISLGTSALVIGLLLMIAPLAASAQGSCAASLTEIAYGDSVTGTIDDSNAIEIYCFEGTRGDEVTISAEATSGNLDTVLLLTNNDVSETFATSDNISASNTDSLIEFTLTQNGAHLIGITRRGASDGTTSGRYRLTLSEGSAVQATPTARPTVRPTPTTVPTEAPTEAPDDNPFGDLFEPDSSPAIDPFADAGLSFDDCLAGTDPLEYNTPITGTLDDSDAIEIFCILGLEGVEITIELEATSGNLEPFILLTDAGIQTAYARSPNTSDDVAVVTYTPENNEILLVGASRTDMNDGDTEGNFRLTVSADLPEVDDGGGPGDGPGGSSDPDPQTFDYDFSECLSTTDPVEYNMVIEGEVPAAGTFQIYCINVFEDVEITITVETISGDLEPILLLTDITIADAYESDSNRDGDRTATVTYLPPRDETVLIGISRVGTSDGDTSGEFTLEVVPDGEATGNGGGGTTVQPQPTTPPTTSGVTLRDHDGDWQDAVAELEDAGIIPAGGDLVFFEDYAFIASTGFTYTSLSSRSSDQNFVMAGELTYDLNGTADGLCVLSSRVQTNASGTANRFLNIGANSDGELIAFDVFGDDDADRTFQTIGDVNTNAPYHMLIVALDGEVSIYLNGRLAGTTNVDVRSGSYGVALLSDKTGERCEARNTWVYRLPTSLTGDCTATASSNVNKRSGPGTNFGRAGVLEANTSLSIDGQATGAQGFTWYRLEDGSFVREDVVTVDGNCSGLPTVSG